jgi:hypothetical protein
MEGQPRHSSHSSSGGLVHHPTVILDNQCWYVLADNRTHLVVTRNGVTRSVRVEEVR